MAWPMESVEWQSSVEGAAVLQGAAMIRSILESLNVDRNAVKMLAAAKGHEIGSKSLPEPPKYPLKGSS